MSKLLDEYLNYDSVKKFNSLPRRIFLDTNILQYLQDFGEYIFEGHKETEDYFTGGKTYIKNSDWRYREIEALHSIFGINTRVPFEFAVAESTYKEVRARRDLPYNQWFYEVLDHWEGIISEYEGTPFSDESQVLWRKAKSDKSLLGSFSDKDQKIILDAIQNDCDAVLTCDFGKDKNKQKYAWDQYRLAIVTPSEFLEIIKPFIALF